MKFGPLAVERAEGALLAHALEAGGRGYRKAHRISREDMAAFQAAGIMEIIAAELEAGDMDENAAATLIASAIAADGFAARPAATGRVNLHATRAGVFTVDRGTIDAANKVDPAITIATLADMKAVEPGTMVATVKIIPFAVGRTLAEQAAAILARPGALSVRGFRARRVVLVQTVLPGLKPSVLSKTSRVTAGRLARSGSTISVERHVAHDAAAIAEVVSELLSASDMAIVFGASAMSDFDDVIPAAIRAAGGRVIRAGMPVDPGNLLVLGEVDGKPVIGAPGCARSPKENGFDWILDRIAADISVTDADVAGMGVGGLLMEIATRPQPREAAETERAAAVDAVLLAAGRSSRMGGPNKLMALFDGVPLVRRVVEAALASRARSVTVVTGHQDERLRAALPGLGVSMVHNPLYETGLASSLQAGVKALPADSAGVLVLLGDMPGIGVREIDRLLGEFETARGNAIVRASHDGRRGNPVILPRGVFGTVAHLAGDTGARHIVESGEMPVIDVEIGPAAFVDVDTAEAMAEAGGVLQG